MIQNRVYRLKKIAEVSEGMTLPEGQEIEIVMDVVYVNGNMVPPHMQAMFHGWVVKNPTLFDDVTKNW